MTWDGLDALLDGLRPYALVPRPHCMETMAKVDKPWICVIIVSLIEV